MRKNNPLPEVTGNLPRTIGLFISLLIIPLFLAILMDTSGPGLLAQENEEKEEEKIIREIEHVGLKHTNSRTVDFNIRSKKGTVFSSETLDEDVRRLYTTGLFVDIDWQIVPFQDGVKIIFTFQENELIEDLKFQGQKAFPTKSLFKELKLRINGPFDRFFLNTDLNTIRSLYLNDGYYFVDVSPKIESGLRGKIITFLIREGPRVKIKEIKLSGNDSFPPRRVLLIFPKNPILGLMQTKSSGWLVGRYYQEKKLLLDIERIKAFYRNEGWLDVEAFVEDLVFNEMRNVVTVLIHTDEGLKYCVRNLKITGNTSVETDQILEKLKLKREAPYKLKDVFADRRVIKSLFGRLGLIDCNVEVRTYFPEKEPGRVDVTYRITEGTHKYLEKIYITGNTKTRDKVIRREGEIYPGELMDFGKVSKSIDNLRGTRYFEPLLLDYSIEDGSQPDMKILTFKVEEGQTGMLQLGGAYSSDHGFGGTLQLTQNNFDVSRLPTGFGDFFGGQAFAGGGQTFSAYWQPGTVRSQYGMSFREPYFFNRPIEQTLKYFNWNREWSDYDERRVGGGLGFTRRFPDGWRLGIKPRFETIKITDVEPDAPSVIFPLIGTNRLRSLEGIVGLDKRDSRYFPSQGYYLGFSYEYVGGTMGGDLDFTKVFLRAQNFMTLASTPTKKLILSTKGTFGRVEEFDNTLTVPFFERYYAGGRGTVRGFDYRTISPKEGNIEIGGKIISLYNVELTYPLYTEQLRERSVDIIRGALFFDCGNVVNELHDLRWDTYRTSVGFEMRFILGVIPVSFSIGYPIKKELGDDVDRVQLNIGLAY